MSDNNDFNDIEIIFDREEFEQKLKKREERLMREKEEAIRRQKKQIKLLLFGVAGFIAICLLITGVVFAVKGIIRNKANKDDNSTIVESEVVVEQIPEEEEVEVIEVAKNFLGKNDSIESGNTKISGTLVFNGYASNQTADTYVLESENTLSQYAILIDGVSGDVVCQREGFSRMNPASMTKILTILVAAEHLSEEDLEKPVTISQEDVYYAYKNGLSGAGFSADETVTVRDLFYGTILPSGADAAIALARYVAGDEEKFVELMNEKISELGLKNTHFTNCVGLYNEEHYTTCAEMAMILKATIENSFCYKVMNTHIYVTTNSTEHPEGIELSNWFLRRIEDKETGGEVMCAKTGFVNESGCCAASYSVQNDGHPYFCVTGNAWSSWRAIYDHVDIYANFTNQ